MDSAGFFIALHDGLFAKEGLTIKYTPAISSETAVTEQLKGQLDISGGNYVSYINEAALNHQPIEVVAEGSIMQQGAQTIFTMPNSKIKTLAQLKGHGGPITALAVHEQILVSASTDTTALVWNLAGLNRKFQ